MSEIYVVTATSLNLRSTPLVTSDNRIAVLPKGQIVTELLVVPTSTNWSEVSTILDEKTLQGFVSNSFLSPATEAILQEIRENTKVYQQPTEQDVEGKGIPTNGQKDRSETLCPVYVLSPRRQTDSLVRQLIALTPTNDTDFIIAERLVQFPEDYLSTISKSKQVVLVQSFVGIGSSSKYPDWAKERHAKELWRIEKSIRLLLSLNLQITAISCAMGDSLSPVALDVRKQIQKQIDLLLSKYGLSNIKQPITWGADELVAMAIAQTLPKAKVRIRIANDDTKLHYDANRKPSKVLAEKLQVIGLEKTTDDNWDFEIAILTRRKNGSTDNYQKGDVEQAKLDKQFLDPYKSYSTDQRKKLVIVDGRLFNGAWNADSVLPFCDLLAFGSWGTFGNCVGSTLAVAKILFHTNNPVAQKQLYLEAVAHDVFANGYKEAQRKDEPESFNNRLDKATDIKFKHFEGYPDAGKTQRVFNLLNEHVNQRMQEHFSATPCAKDRIFRFTPQLWRTFESEIHLWPRLDDEVHRVGIYNTNLGLTAFDPSSDQLA